MNRLKKFLFAGGSAALMMAGIALVSTPSAEAALNSPPPTDCTFCAAQVEACQTSRGRSGYRTCYYRMSGPGTCPPCTSCVGSGLIDPWE